jgi:hypothetical protein
MIDEGIADLGKNSGISPSSDDLFYGGNLTKWIKFANTLKLKMYNQIRLVENVSGPVNQLISNPDLLIGPGDDFEFQYGASGSPMNRNPGYQQEYAPQGMYYYINPYFYEILTGQNTFFPEAWNPYAGIRDPRVPYYFYNQLQPGQAAENPTAYKDGEFVSIYMFSFNIDPNEGFDQSSSQTVAGLYPLGGKYDDGQGGVSNYNGAGDTPQRILTYMDHLYIRAELAIVGVTSEDPRALLEAAVNESFRKVDEVAAAASAPALDPALVDSYKTRLFDLYDNADDDEVRLQHIMTQKWIAKYGSAFDSYTDYRRTGYPILQDGNADFLNVTAQTRAYPLSYPWSTDELQVNPSAPSQKQITQYPVFWDVN